MFGLRPDPRDHRRVKLGSVRDDEVGQKPCRTQALAEGADVLLGRRVVVQLIVELAVRDVVGCDEVAETCIVQLVERHLPRGHGAPRDSPSGPPEQSKVCLPGPAPRSFGTDSRDSERRRQTQLVCRSSIPDLHLSEPVHLGDVANTPADAFDVKLGGEQLTT